MSRARLVPTLLIALAFTLTSMALFAPRAEAIVGGQLASEDYSNMAAFLDDGSQICGASLIDPEWILSAAHCVSSLDASHYSFRIGGVRDLSEQGGETIQADQVIVHPDYEGNGYDISLFHLERPSTFAPIRVADPATDRDLWEPGDEARVIGYGGQVFLLPSIDEQLREVDVPVVSDEDCEFTVPQGIDEATEVCAGELHGTEDSCQGDSGGPLMVRDEAGDWVQMGVVSWGNGCAVPTQYGIYARVGDTTLYDWINETIASNSGGGEDPPPPPPPSEFETHAVGEQAYIAGSTPNFFRNGITQNEFELTCLPEPLSQGVDGWVWELPSELAVPGAFAKVTGDSFFYDLDIHFYDADCSYLDGSSTADLDERAEIPEGTAFVLAHNFFGVDVLADLTVDVPVGDSTTSTSLSVTGPESARYNDEVTLSARLTDESGAPIADQPIRFALLDADGNTLQFAPGTPTDTDGVSTTSMKVAIPAGDYTVEAVFIGEPDRFVESRASSPFQALTDGTELAVSSKGVGDQKKVTAVLTDDSGVPVAGRTLELFADCDSLGSGQTGEDGSVTLPVGGRHRAVTTEFSALFEGDSGAERYYGSSTAGPAC